MMITIPQHFKEVSVEAFEDYLKWCPDYTRTGYSGTVAYEFKSGKRFAVVKEGNPEKVFVDPAILKLP